MLSVGTWTHAYRNESQTHGACNVTLAGSLCACGRTGEGVSAHQVRMKGVNKGNVSRVGAEALGKLEVCLTQVSVCCRVVFCQFVIFLTHLPVFDVVQFRATVHLHKNCTTN
jgi:hypothetical protein